MDHEYTLKVAKLSNRTEIKSGRIYCKICNRSYAYRRGLLDHFTKHPDHCKSKYNTKIQCGNCEIFLKTIVDLRLHLMSHHQIDVKSETKNFKNIDDFKKWKEHLEEETNSRYVTSTGAKGWKGKKKYYYRCHRSGTYDAQCGDERKRSLKKQGSCKIGRYCTSGIVATENLDHSVNVVYCSTHHGHGEEVDHLFLTRSQKESIIAQVHQGVSVSHILETMKKSTSESNPIRITRKNINRIISNKTKVTEILEKQEESHFFEDDAYEEVIEITSLLQDAIDVKRRKSVEVLQAAIELLKNTTDDAVVDKVLSLGREQLHLLRRDSTEVPKRVSHLAKYGNKCRLLT